MRVQNGLGKIITFCFGSPYGPPLTRREFIKPALAVLFLRWGFVWGLGAILFYVDQQNPMSEEYAFPYGAFVLLPLVCIFYLPYFFLVYRRLAAVGSPLPKVFTWIMAIIIICVSMLLPSEGTTAYVVPLIIHFGLYLVLFILPDKIALAQEAKSI